MKNVKRPNIIIITLDQASRKFIWENDKVKEFRRRYMPNMEYIFANSIDFKNHQISSAACVPSRACLFTGTNSKKTQVHQTDGVAKNVHELNWIDRNKTPTLGNIFCTLTASGREYVKDHAGNKMLLGVERKKVISGMTGYDYSGICDTNQTMLLGNMVQPQISERMFKLFTEVILK